MKPRPQSAITRTYERAAAGYDLWNRPMEWFGLASKRRRLLAHAHGSVLEIGIGTGLNLEHYPDAVELTGIDVAEGMLARARKRAARLGRKARLEQADVQQLPYEDGCFDTAVATCVFCSVADPVAGLRELARVVRPDGQVLLLEHVRPENPLGGLLADLASPLSRRLFGPELNRPTEQPVEQAGLEITEIRRDGVWREILAQPCPPRQQAPS